MFHQIEKVVVLGAGTMGKGIAQWFCQNGIKVQLTDVNHQALIESYNSILASWDKLQAKGKFDQFQIETFKKNLSHAGKAELDPHADLIIEAIVEDKDVKRSVFKEYDEHFAEKTIFASNTSSIPIASLCHDMSVKRRSRFLGLHFFNPATLMKLVEIIKTPWTDEKIVTELENFFNKAGKETAQCQDRPGFIVNRVARNFYGEALRIAKHDDEEVYKAIDSTMKEVGGFKMGPFELMDLIGVDVNYQVSNSVWNAFYNEARFTPHHLQKQMVDSGRHGRKTKQGFYKYE